ncbi:hypothetical protein [Streptomyces heilongjiangensis]|uniref:Secreted protein n=1 Tax=Streptomyces heilongjiangensis TaxID=945052 RepID=A0ABW1BG04_9ACTN|nr:hypothetical protein [Streptomyces heilongjiangensis]MDC2950483.1 hypothetical protein [Streptomyces heilongjiangensis]
MRRALHAVPAAGHRTAVALVLLLAVLIPGTQALSSLATPSSLARSSASAAPSAVSASAPSAPSALVEHARPGPAPDPVAAGTAAAHTYTAPRVEASCALDCAVQVLARQGQHGERPSLPEHHATDDLGGPTGLPAEGTYAPVPSARPAVSPGRSAHDRGRAPPASSGI